MKLCYDAQQKTPDHTSLYLFNIIILNNIIIIIIKILSRLLFTKALKSRISLTDFEKWVIVVVVGFGFWGLGVILTLIYILKYKAQPAKYKEKNPINMQFKELSQRKKLGEHQPDKKKYSTVN